MSAQAHSAQLARDSGRTALLMGLGVVAKLVVDVVLVASFGLTGATDAFFVAYTLLILVEALIYPACQSGLVPVFVRVAAERGRESAWAVFNSLLTAAALVSLALSVIGVLGSSVLVRALAPGLDAETAELAGGLAEVLLLGLLFVAPIGVMRAFLNANHLYGAPASLELIRGGSVLGVVAVVSALTGTWTIGAVALGFAVAALAQSVVLGWVIVRHLGFGYRPALDGALLRSAGVERMLSIPLLDHAVGQGVLIAERVVGSFLPVGSISAISYGHRLASVIGNTLFTGVEVVSLSSFSASLVGGSGRDGEARATLTAGVRLVVLLGLPVAAAVWVLQQPLIELIFGRTDSAMDAAAAMVLGIYALGIPFYGYLLVARSYLFAQGRPQRSLLMSCAHLIAVVLLAPAMASTFGAAGVAWAFNLGQALACAIGIVAIGGLRGSGAGLALPALIGKVAAAACVMAALMSLAYAQVTRAIVGAADGVPAAGLLPGVAAACASGGLVLVVLLGGLRVEEICLLKSALRARLSSRQGRDTPTAGGVEPEL